MDSFKLVVTESEFRRLLRRGYVGQVVADAGQTGKRFEPIELIGSALVAARAEAVKNPESQLGEPVSLTWNSAVLAEVSDSQIAYEGDIVQIYALLPLLSGTFTVRFKSMDRIRHFGLELNTELDSKLLEQVELGDIDPELMSGGLAEHSPRPADQQPLPLNDPPYGLTDDLHEEAIRLDRLQSGAKLLFASEGGSMLPTLLSAVIDPDSTTESSELETHLSSIRWMKGDRTSFLFPACEYLLSRPARSTLSPLTIEEKSELIETVARHAGRLHGERDLLLELLHLVRSGESLNHLLARTADETIQGLTIFMSNNRDPREVAALKPRNFGVAPSALALCAFLTGLRYQSHLLPIDILWPALRRADILDFTSTVNQFSWGPMSAIRRTTIIGDELRFGEEVFTRPTEFDVLDLLECKRWIRVRTKKDSFAHSGARRIIVSDRAKISRCRVTTFGEIRELDQSQFAKSFDIQPKKATKSKAPSWKILPFRNRKVDVYIESLNGIEITPDGEFWVELIDGKRHKYESAVLIVPLDALDLRELKQQSKLSPSKLRTLIVERMSRRNLIFHECNN